VTITAATFLVLISAEAVGVDAQPLHHRLDRLLGERRVLQGIAGVVEADHQAVAHQHVLAHALELDDVLDPRAREGGTAEERAAQDRERGETQQVTHAKAFFHARVYARSLPAVVRQKAGWNHWLIGSARRGAGPPGRNCPALTIA
jgi:hypothetical protein